MVFLQGFLYQFSNHEFLNIKLLFLETKIVNLTDCGEYVHGLLWRLVRFSWKKTDFFSSSHVEMVLWAVRSRGGGGGTYVTWNSDVTINVTSN